MLITKARHTPRIAGESTLHPYRGRESRVLTHLLKRYIFLLTPVGRGGRRHVVPSLYFPKSRTLDKALLPYTPCMRLTYSLYMPYMPPVK